MELADKHYSFDAMINWIGISNEDEVRNQIVDYKKTNPKRQVWNYPLFELPSRLWHYFLSDLSIKTDLIFGELPLKEINRLIEILMRTIVHVNGKTTFKEEFVTCGGIELSQINSDSMMSNKHKNLFFAGEILNIDGITGGFNFQSAWSTSWVAAKYIGLDQLNQ